ncbi:MAG: tetratricopeptide repeat protein [Planctomycetes bacterium]|nr:tetratricopeptide repeat protein [Planctomycetota bacterium]
MWFRSLERALAPLVLASCVGSAPTYDQIALVKYDEANALFDQGRYADCIDRYEYVVKWRDQIRDAYLRLATCYERTGEPDRGVRTLERLLRVDRRNLEALRRLAAAYAARNRVAEAVEMNRRILEIDPNDAGAKAELERMK